MKRRGLLSKTPSEKQSSFLKGQLSMNLALIGNNLPNDFFIEGNHARMSQRKVAQVITVNESSITRYLERLAQHNPELVGMIKNKGFDGVALNDIVGYYATSNQVSQEVKDNCVKLLIESSKVGFQVLIDKMAGLESSIESNEMKLFNDYCQVTDMIFRNTHIKPELIAGVKLSQAQKLLPHLADTLKANRQLLVESTASNVKLMTPTQLGERLSISGQKVNKRLIDAGLQVKNENKKSRKEPSYIPTDKGHEFCSFTLSIGQNGDTTSYQQLLWYESVLSVIG